MLAWARVSWSVTLIKEWDGILLSIFANFLLHGNFTQIAFHCTFNSPLKVLAATTRLHGSSSTCSSSGRAAHGLDPPEMACLASLSAISLPATPSCPNTQLMVTCAPCRLPLHTHSEHDSCMDSSRD